MLLAKFVVNWSNGLGGVRKSKIIIFQRALVAHGEAVTCHLRFMSFGQTSVEICNTLYCEQNAQEVII